MEYIQLGKSGLDVSRICFGTWQFGGDWGSVERDDAMDDVGLHRGDDPRRGGARVELLERALRPLTGPPWLEVFARR